MIWETVSPNGAEVDTGHYTATGEDANAVRRALGIVENGEAVEIIMKPQEE